MPAHARTRLLTILGYLSLGLGAVAVLYTSVSYLTADYETLARWYQSLGPSYRSDYWQADFFTPTTKANGNFFVGAGVILFGLVSFLLRRISALKLGSHPPNAATDHPALAVLILTLVAAIILGNIHLSEAYDEVFSAIRITEGHWFHTWSYYMLPNNHQFFNLTNKVLFGWAPNLIVTGRILAGVAYLALGRGMQFWLRPTIENPWWRTLLVVAAMIQFPVWGFAVQARGYLFLLLASWAATVGLYGWLTSRNRDCLWLYVVGSVVAFATVPVFLYVAPALILYWVWEQIRQRQPDPGFLPANLLVGALTYLFYLPTLAFSGLSAIGGNRYVDPSSDTLAGFLDTLVEVVPFYASYALGGAWAVPGWLAIPLCLLPACYFLRSAAPPRMRFLARIYLLTLLTSAVIILLMRVAPFNRVIIFQTHLAWLLLVVMIWRVLGNLGAAPDSRRGQLGAGAGAMGVIGIMLWTGASAPSRFTSDVYYYPVNGTKTWLLELKKLVPPNAKVTFTDEAFFPEYLLRDRIDPINPDLGNYLVRSENDQGFVPPPGAEVVGVVSSYTVYLVP